MSQQLSNWTQARSHVRRFSVNAGLQMGSQVLPLVAGAIAIPQIYRQITAADFGVFTVALSMLGLFALLDLGLGRATVRFMARAFVAGDRVGAAAVLSQSALVLGGFSGAACAVFLLAVPEIAGHWFQSSAVHQSTLRGSLYILAAALPLVALTSVFRAVLESREKFLLISIIQVILGVSTYYAPLLLSMYTQDVRLLIAGSVACRGFAFLAFLMCAKSVWHGPFPWRDIKGRGQSDFRSFSFWIVISNVVGSVIVYGDRAIVVRMFGLSVIAFYNIPLELLGRLMIIVNSAATVVFPALSRTASDDPRFEDLYGSLTAVLGAVTGVVFLAMSMLAPAGLYLWLGSDFRSHSTTLVQVLLVGLAFQTLNVFALATLNARGFVRPITVMHLLETPVYFWAIYFFGGRFGLPGVATVWSSRLIVEYVCFVGFQAAINNSGRVRRSITGGIISAGNVLPLIIFAMSANKAVAIASCGLCATASLVWARSSFIAESPRCNN